MVPNTFLVLFAILVGQSGAEEFFVKPGGVELSQIVSKDGYGCSFTYIAQGGTHENWVMDVHLEGNNLVCEVERPQGTSYLFFQHVSLKFTENAGAILHFDARGNGGAPLSEDQFKLESEKSRVSSVDGKFQSQLASLKVIGQLEKQDL